MVEWYVIVIVALLCVSYYQYVNPTKANEMLTPMWGQVKTFLSTNLHWGGNTTDTDTNPCPDTNDPVCGDDGNTYKNSCEAALNGISQVTPGGC